MFKPQTIGIIGGKGLIGSFMSRFFKSHGYHVLISDIRTRLTNKKLAKICDVAVISVPIHATKKVIREVSPLLQKHQLLCDVTSLKVFPVHEMLGSKASVIGLHPMFRPGPSRFKGQTIVMCPARATAAQKNWLKKLFKKSGARVREMTSQKHDQLMGIVQALIHFHSLVLGQTLRGLHVNLGEIMAVMSPIYRMQFDVVCRIFAQNPTLYASIGMENPETKKITGEFESATAKLRKILVGKKRATFMKEFKKTAAFLGPFSKKALLESDKLLASFQK